MTRYLVPSKLYLSVVLVNGRALDKMQGSSEREGAAAWRAMHEQ